MSSVLVAPGSLTREVDLSLYTPSLVTTILGLVGTCTKGVTDKAQLFTDGNSFTNACGGSDPNHPAVLAGLWYLKFGYQLRFVRVANQDLLAASSVSLPSSAASSGVLTGSNTGPFTFSGPTAGTTTGTIAGPFTITSGGNDQLAIAVNGGSVVNMVLTSGSRTAAQVASDINFAVGATIATVATGGQITLTSPTTGTSSEINIEAPIDNPALTTLGFTINAYLGDNGTNTVSLKIDGGGTQNITLSPGSLSASQVASQLGGVLTGAVASVVNNAVVVTSSSTGTASSVQGSDSTGLATLGFDTTLHSGTNSGASSVVVTANSPGTWGNKLTLTVTAGNVAGTVNLVVANNGYTVEVWRNLSKTTSSASYWQTQINGNSSFITVVDSPLVAQPAVVAKLPLAGGNDGLSGVTDADFIGTIGDGYSTGLQTLADPATIDVNLVAIPGQTSMSVHSALVSFCETRGDCSCSLDPELGLNASQMVDFRLGQNAYSSRVAVDSNRATFFYPWINAFEPNSGTTVWMPPSAAAIRACAYNDSVGQVWTEILGVNRGRLPEATGIERSLSTGDQGYLYENGINPIVNIRGYGITIMGGKTLQVAPTSLDRWNVRRMLDYLHKITITVTYPLIGEPNTPALWRRLTGLLQPTLQYLQDQQGVQAYQIICDASTNPQNLMNAHELHAKIGILPVPGAEFIYTDFVLVPDMSTFTNYLANTPGQ